MPGTCIDDVTLVYYAAFCVSRTCALESSTATCARCERGACVSLGTGGSTGHTDASTTDAQADGESDAQSASD